MSEQAPERPVQPAPAKKENVLTRKLGPLPTWAWVAIAAALILGYVFFFGKKNKQQGGGGISGGTATGPGAGTTTIINRIIRPRGQPPHTRHHRRGDHDDEDDEDRRHARDHDRHREARSAGAAGPGPGPDTDVPVGMDRRDKRGKAVPGALVAFRTAEHGATPSLQDVANHYDTAPEAIIQEAEGRGYPSSTAWKRYVARHDWASPLPPATQFQILAHPG